MKQIAQPVRGFRTPEKSVRKLIGLGVLAVTLVGLTVQAADEAGGTWKCEKKVVTSKGVDYDYQYFQYQATLQLAISTQYTVVIRCEADGMGDGPLGDGVLTQVEQYSQASTNNGTFNLSANGRVSNPPRRSDTPIPWATSHYYVNVTLFQPDGEQVFSTGNVYVPVSYP